MDFIHQHIQNQQQSSDAFYSLMVPWTDDFYANEPDVIAVFHQDNTSISNFWTRFQWYGCILMSGCGLRLVSFLFLADASEFVFVLFLVLAVLSGLTAGTVFYVRGLERLKQASNGWSNVIAVTREGIRIQSFEIVDGVISLNSTDTSSNAANKKKVVRFKCWGAQSSAVLTCL
jgi:hypothetical protein